jgi:hypothetical protein
LVSAIFSPLISAIFSPLVNETNLNKRKFNAGILSGILLGISV